MIEALRDPWSELREDAARALGMIGDAKAIEPLKEALSRRDQSSRSDAAWALSQLLGKDSVPILVEEMRFDCGFHDREMILGLIENLTGQKFGWDHAKWRAWLEAQDNK